jgi:cytochrome d ubiquinol oxidase subunit II
MVMGFPRLMANAFSGYYLALFLILWCVLLRGVSIEVGGHINDRLWQTFWDAAFVLSNILLAVLFGAASGNVVRGVPLNPDGTFYLAFFTDFRVHGNVGLLDWYTLSMALFCVLLLTAHGATYLTMKTEGPVHERAAAIARRLWIAAVPAFLVITLLTWLVRPELLGGLMFRPLAWVTLSVCIASVAALMLGISGKLERLALIGSTFLLFGLLMTGAAALFPVLLFSTINSADRLTASDCAAPDQSLWIATGWWLPALVLAFVLSHHHSTSLLRKSERLKRQSRALLIETSFCEAITTANEQKSISLEKRAEATYAEYRRQKASGLGGCGFRLPLCVPLQTELENRELSVS